MPARTELIVKELLGRCGRRHAEDAGIRLAEVRVSPSQRAASEVAAAVPD